MEGNKKITVVTHSSGFHNDDVFAVATLQIYLKDKGEVEVIRSRDIAVIEKADYVVDVGLIYDPSINRFDHHQKGGAGVRENGIPYASFGLVWKQFGEELCGNKEIAESFDRTFVQTIDSSDNGIQIMKSTMKGFYPFDISLIINTFMPTWKEDEVHVDDIFNKIVSYVKLFIERAIKTEQDEFEGKQKVLEIYNKTEDKRLIEVESRYPWGEVLSEFQEPLYVIYKNHDENWTIKAVADDFFLMTNRKLLPESWAGKTGAELEEATGVNGSWFCHNKRFMAVAQTKEAILKLAQIALDS